MNQLNKAFTLFFFLCGMYMPVTAQSPKEFHFPEGFDQNQVIPHRIVYKLKSQNNIAKTAREASPIGVIKKEAIQALGAFQPERVFPADHMAFKYKSVRQIGERTKKLALIHEIEISPAVDLEYAINYLRQQPEVAYAEPVYADNKPLLIPNDPFAASGVQYHLDKIQAFDAWDIQTGSSDVLVGIVDNGCSVTFSELTNNVRNPVFIDSPFDLLNDISGSSATNSFDQDNNVSGGSHGVFVSWVACGVPNNSQGTLGTGFNTPFLPVKVAADENLNSYVDSYAGVLYAAKQGCSIINMSWGRTGSPSAFDEDILETVFYDDDVVLIAAAGNDDDQDFFYPASYEVVLSVAATDIRDLKAGFSSYNSKVDISAPGQEIVMNGSNSISGTSYAAPLVAGSAALIRAQYPDWNATQVKARLMTTTDDIYQIDENIPFQGQLGSGRLNMWKALSEETKAISLSSFQFLDANNGELTTGINTRLKINLVNFLDPLVNLKIKAETLSPFVTIQDSLSELGSIPSFQAFNNDGDYLQIEIDDNTPANTEASLLLTYEDNGYTYQEQLTLLLNPSAITENQIKVSLNDRGRLAIFDNSFDQLFGMKFQNRSLMREAGLMIGIVDDAGTIKVSDAVRAESGVIDQDFNLITSFRKNTLDTVSTTIARYEDITNNSERIGVEVSQKTYAWLESSLSEFIILEYEIKNISTDFVSLRNLQVGLFANWDIDNLGESILAWDDDLNLGYVYNPQNQNIYGGLMLLTIHPDRANSETKQVSHYGFDARNFDPNININDGFSTIEKYRALTYLEERGMDIDSLAEGSVYQVLAGKFDSLRVGETRSMAFALVVGNNLADIQNNALSAQEQFFRLKKGPIPDIPSTIQVCLGDDVVLQPSNGNMFSFYAQAPENTNIRPLFTGRSLKLSNVTSQQVLYVSNLDSLFESDYVTINLEIDAPDALFNPSTSIVNLTLDSTLSLLNRSLNAESFSWSIQNADGSAGGYDFLSGTNSNSMDPVISFSQLGTYEIKLVTQSRLGCTDSVTQNVVVVEEAGLTTSLSRLLSTELDVFPNPAQEYLQLKGDRINREIRIEIFNAQGLLVHKDNFRNEAQLDQRIDFSQFARGIYFLKVSEPEGYVIKKIIKQ